MEPSKWIVIGTGITLVFAILVLLTLIIKLQGKIFTGIDHKKQVKADAASEQPAKAATVQTAPVAKAAAPAAMPGELIAAIAGATEAANAPFGVPGEIVAAITAAVAAVTDGPFEIRNITKSRKKTSLAQNAWSRAAVRAYTEPF